jgi:hypothetical protein
MAWRPPGCSTPQGSGEARICSLGWCAATSDRVVALFGDGDLGSQRDEVLARVARMKAENIRFVTRGLGSYAAHVFGEISDEDPSSATIADVSDLAVGIADMATTLRTKGIARPRPSTSRER